MGKGAFKGSVTKVGGDKSAVSLSISSGSGTSSAGSAGGTLQNTLLEEVTTLAYRAPEGLFSATRYSSAGMEHAANWTCYVGCVGLASVI